MRYSFGDTVIDEEAFELRRRGTRIHVEPLALELILYMAQRRGALIQKSELLDALWSGVSVTDASLTRTVSVARKALRGAALIENVYGRGYRLYATSTPSGVNADRDAG
ncbi:MAG: hypothetical protein RL385_1782 [Pseudomonadota bacterium]|jgi:DNA-binding winged helix-turn-helix (wHTH) protein